MAYVGWILRFEFYFQVKSLFKKQVYHQKKKNAYIKEQRNLILWVIIALGPFYANQSVNI